MANFCKNCGAMLNDNEKFCSKCGTRIEKKTKTSEITYQENNYASPINTDKKKKKISKGKKVKVILITVVVVILVILISLTALFFTGSSYNVYRDMQNQEYSEAVSDYTSGVKNNLIQELFLKIALSNYDEKVIEKFENGKIEYNSTVDALNALQEMGLGDMSESIDKITLIYEENTAFEQGNKYYESGDYENAIKEYSKISESNEKYQEAQTKLNELYPKYVNYITDSVAEYASNGNYEDALTLINTALEILPESVDTASLTSLRNESLTNYKSKVMSDVTSLVNQNQFIDALDMINYAITVDDNEEFQKTRTTVEKKYTENITATVQKYLDNEDYIAALRTVNSALEILPENSDLKNLKTKVENETPTYLLDICSPYQTSEGYEEYINGEKFIAGGTEFTNGFKIPASSGTAIFNIDGKYSTLSFSVGHLSETNFDNATIKIYLDGTLSKTYKMSYEDLAKRITVNITGVKQIKFLVEADDDMGSYWVSYGFGNVIVK